MTARRGLSAQAKLAVLFAAVALTGSAGYAQSEPEPSRLEQVLLELDREFDRDSAERGSAAWAERFADDGELVGGSQVITGPTAIGAAVGFLNSEAVTQRWQPLQARVAASGDLGYTRGTYERRVRAADGTEDVATGSYLTVWRRGEDGMWRIVLDIGSPDQGP